MSEISEGWLYQITLNNIAVQHALNLVPLLKFGAKIMLPSCSAYGTPLIQIDVVAADAIKRVLVLSECKQFLTFQGASECAEQIVLKTHLLRNYLTGTIGCDHSLRLTAADLNTYEWIQYISLGSYTGNGYANAKARTADELTERLRVYSSYLESIGRNEIGILLFLNQGTAPIVRRAIAHA
jgi:hypothetical protein